MEFPKYVTVNTSSLVKAIEMAATPMSEWFDPQHDDLPYFENIVTGPRFGNYHHTSWSGGHCPGRWLETLYHSQLVCGIPLDAKVLAKLKKWVYKVYENGIGLPANLSTETFEPLMETDLCNLRESFFGLTSIFLMDGDWKAIQIAETVIQTVERYFDFDAGKWDNERFQKDTGAWGVGLFTGDREHTRFCNTFGRFIGGLTRYYQATGSAPALSLALRLTDVAFRTEFPDGSFDAARTAPHPYSTTSMLSGIALVAELTNDQDILGRLRGFMENGFYDIAMDCGWVTENTGRDDLVGELNNSCDLLEVCLVLGKAGFSEYYARGERMLRGHILPSQLLDTCFISDEPNDDPSKDHMASRVRGALGFACPYGHEAAPESEISYNWDIVGGISGICMAKKHVLTGDHQLLSLNMLFDYEDDRVQIKSPYSNNDILTIKMRVRSPLRIRLSKAVDASRLLTGLEKTGIHASIGGRWLYLCSLPVGTPVSFTMPFTEERQVSCHKSRKVIVRWRGDEVTGMTSKEKRLCFFPEIEEMGGEGGV